MSHVIVLDDGTEEIPIDDGYSLHVNSEGWVWLDTEVACHDGICIGLGTDRRSALADARASLASALAAVDAELSRPGG